MRKVIRLRCIIIVVVFALLAAVSVSVIFYSADAHAFSALSNGSGTKDDPYIITTMSQLHNLQAIAASNLAKQYTQDKYFRLDRDISTAFTVTSLRNGFFGHFDGNGHTIKVLSETGLFCYLYGGASISNLNLTVNFKIHYAEEYFGLVYAVAENATIDNCTITGNITVDFSGWKTRLKSSRAAIDFGIFSITNNGTISNCRFYGSISQPKFEVLGTQTVIRGSIFAFYGSGTVVDCYAEGNIQLVVSTYIMYLDVISRSNTVQNCEYKGDILLSLSEQANAYTGAMITVFALGQSAVDSTFNGNIILDYRNLSVPKFARHTFKVGSDDSNCVHNGKIEIINRKSGG